MIRVADAAGNLYNFTATDAARFVRSTPGARIITPAKEVARITELPEPRQDRPLREMEAIQAEKIAELEAQIARLTGGALTFTGATIAPTEAPAVAEGDLPDLEAMHVPELKAYAAEHGYGLDGATLKAEIIEAIKAGHEAASAAPEADAGDGSEDSSAGAGADE